MHPEFEAVIGLEVHVQLSTETKLFCSCRARLGDELSVAEEKVNAHTCPVCTGHPGALPVLNKKAIEYAIRAGLSTQCTVHPKSVFARKNYFYPDLPKGYQISQFDQPICEHGQLIVPLKNGESKKITIQRIHVEEDAGKNIHMSGYSIVNFNRACVPLIEIVSGPDMRSSEEASAYLKALYAIVTYIGICDGNLQEGNFRCDANVSIRPKGSAQFGTRAEIKNVNSFRFVEKAIDYEIQRQIEVVQSGGRVIQETRGFDSEKGQTFSQRSKEEAQDYRYFPDPDLVPLVFDQKWIEQIKAALPELPEQKKSRYVQEYQLSSYDAGVLTGSKEMAAFFESVLSFLSKRGEESKKTAKPVANFLTGEVSRLCNEEDKTITQSKLKPEYLADLYALVQKNEISNTAAKQILAHIWSTGGEVSKAVDQLGLRQVNDTSALEPIVDKIILDHPGQVAEYRGGKDKLFGFFVGQVMKASGGKANPGLLQEMLKKKLKG